MYIIKCMYASSRKDLLRIQAVPEKYDRLGRRCQTPGNLNPTAKPDRAAARSFYTRPRSTRKTHAMQEMQQIQAPGSLGPPHEFNPLSPLSRFSTGCAEWRASGWDGRCV